MADATTHLIGLLLGTEEDWPTAFETLLGRLGPVKDASGTTHRVDVERQGRSSGAGEDHQGRSQESWGKPGDEGGRTA